MTPGPRLVSCLKVPVSTEVFIRLHRELDAHQLREGVLRGTSHREAPIRHDRFVT